MVMYLGDQAQGAGVNQGWKVGQDWAKQSSHCKFNCNLFVIAAWWFISRDCSCALLWLYPILNPESCQEAYLNVGSQSLVWMTSTQCWNAGGLWHWHWRVYAQECTLRLSIIDFPTERVQYRRVFSGLAKHGWCLQSWEQSVPSKWGVYCCLLMECPIVIEQIHSSIA